MNKYVIAYLNGHNGELKQEVVEATSKLEALISYLNWWEEDSEKPVSINGLYDMVANSDSVISILELKGYRKGPARGAPMINVGLND